MKFLSLYVLAVLIFTSSVQAREEFWYVGAGGGATFLEDREDAFDNVDEKSTMGKLYVGYRASSYVAFEAEYSDLGEYDYTRGPLEEKAKYQAASFLIVIMYPLVWDDFELLTPIGVSIIDSDYGIDDETIAGGRLGFGLAYTPTKHFTIRAGADVTVFKLEATVDDVTEEFTQNLVSTYITLQYNF